MCSTENPVPDENVRDASLIHCQSGRRVKLSFFRKVWLVIPG